MFILAGLFCLIVGWPFFNYIVISGNGNTSGLSDSVLKPYFGNMNIVFLFLCPLITMGSFAEERKQHTLDLLLKSRLTIPQIVLGKFFSAFIPVLFMLSLSLICPLILCIAGYNDWGILFSGHGGILLCLACYISTGIFCSSLTKNQIMAAVTSFGILLFSMLLVLSVNVIENPLMRHMFGYLSLPFHYQSFAHGSIRSFNIVYFASFWGLFFYLTCLSLRSRKW